MPERGDKVDFNAYWYTIACYTINRMRIEREQTPFWNFPKHLWLIAKQVGVEETINDFERTKTEGRIW